MASSSELSSHQKAVITVIAAIAALTLVFAFYGIQKRVDAPFERDPNTPKYLTVSEREAENERILRSADTDGDGLNDYDELHIFRTSPFLEDSDSDGIQDGEEVAAGYDPNCPRGQVCRQRGSTTPTTSYTTPSLGGTPITPTGSGSATISRDPTVNALQDLFGGDLSDLTPENFAAKVESLPTDELRDFLVRLGIPKETLDKTPDDVLRAMVSETFQETVGPDYGQGTGGTAEDDTGATEDVTGE